MSIALLILGALLLFWGLGAYNRLMRLRSAVSSSWLQLEEPLNALAQDGLQLAEAGPRWLPAEQPAFEALSEQSQALQLALRAVAPAPFNAEPVAELAVAHALQASALQRVLALLEHHARSEDSEDGERQRLVEHLRAAQKQREFGKQLFNGRVHAYNAAVAEVPTRALAGLYGFHDAKTF